MRGDGASRRLRVLSIPGRHSDNRYVQLFCDALEEAGAEILDVDSRGARLLRFDVLHLHFPHFYVVRKSAPVAALWFLAFAAVLAACRASGRRVVYQVHDVAPFHVRNAWLLWPFLDMVHRAAHGLVFLSPSSQAEFRRRNPAQAGKPSLTLPIGPYPARMLDPQTRRSRRRELSGETGAFVVGCLGDRQARKGLDAAAMLPERLADGRRVRLLVAGATQPEYAAEARAVLARVPASMLTFRDGRLSDDELNEALQSVHVALVPYTEGWNSSMALLVLSNRTRCLCSDLPMFTDLQAEVGAAWVETFSRSGDARANLRAALERVAASEPSEADERALDRFLADTGFDRGAARLRGFYERLVLGPRQAAHA